MNTIEISTYATCGGIIRAMKVSENVLSKWQLQFQFKHPANASHPQYIAGCVVATEIILKTKFSHNETALLV